MVKQTNFDIVQSDDFFSVQLLLTPTEDTYFFGFLCYLMIVLYFKISFGVIND
jgi:hypothetical protein